MIKIYKTVGDKLIETKDLTEKGTWINLINPTSKEINMVAEATKVDLDYLRYPLDDEERPRIEVDDTSLLTIINVPIIKETAVVYDTIPLGLIVTEDQFITVCLQEVEVMADFMTGRIKGMATYKKTRLLFQILYRSAAMYLKQLREIEKKTNEVELELHKAMRNKELIKLLNLQKSLVYFTTSLKSNEKAMEKLLRTKTLKLYEEDQELLEDVIVENKQALEMAETYSNISSSMMDAFASIISNNLNMVMKFLAAITIIIALPTMVASFFGMNVVLPIQGSPYGFVIVVGISLFLTSCAVVFLYKRDMF